MPGGLHTRYVLKVEAQDPAYEKQNSRVQSLKPSPIHGT